MESIYQPILNTYSQIINEFPDFIIEKIVSNNEFHDNQVLFAIGKNALILASKLRHKMNFKKIVILQVQGYYDLILRDELSDDIDFFESTHPQVTKINIDNSIKVVEILRQYRDHRLHIIITGGTSAAFAIPEEGVSFEAYREITLEAFEKGFEIENLNLSRSYLDKVKSGKLINLLSNSDIHSWIVSDVVSDDPAYVGSGPTVSRSEFDKSTLKWLRKRLEDRHISFDSLDNRMRMNIKMDNNIIIASRHDLIEQLVDKLRISNIGIEIVDIHITGDYTKVGDRMINKLSRSNNTLLLFAGEPTVDTSYFSNSGKGGRISILLFYLSKRISLFNEAFVIGIATDGQDGSSPHHAYVIDNNTFSRIRDFDDYMTNGDTGNLLSSLNCGLEISTNNINLLDIYLLYLQNETKY